MSNSDFEDRLSRIKAAGGQQSSIPAGGPAKQSSALKVIIIGAITVNVGAQLIKLINANYDSIRDQYGIPAALGLGLGSIVLIVLGVVLTIRALSRLRSEHKGQSSLAYKAAESTAEIQSTSTGLGWSRRFGLIFLACMTCATGIQLIRIAHHDYLLIKDQFSGAGAAVLGLGGIALIALGVAMFIRAILPTLGTPTELTSLSYTSTRTGPQAKTSAAARAFFSLLGLALGVVACFFLYLGNVVSHLGVIGEVDKQTANATALGCAVIAFLLVALALFIGFLGLFFRGPPLRRVPVFFLLGSMLLYVTFQNFRIHPLNWPTFVAEVTRQLNMLTVEQAAGGGANP